MARYHDENVGSDSGMERLRNAKMPEQFDLKPPASSYYGKQDWNGSMGYLKRQNKISESDSKRIHASKYGDYVS